MLIFELETDELPAVKKLTGPSIFSKRHSEQFLKKYKGKRTAVEGKAWTAEVERRFRRPEDVLRHHLKRSVNELTDSGIASHVAKRIHAFRVLDRESLLEKAGDRGFAAFLTKYFKNRII